MVEHLEKGDATQLVRLVRVCRMLGLVEGFDVRIPQPMPSPVAQLKLRGKVRKCGSAVKLPAAPTGKWQRGNQA